MYPLRFRNPFAFCTEFHHSSEVTSSSFGGILPPYQFSPLDIAHFYDPTKEMVVIPDGARVLPDAALEEPKEGVTYECTYEELLYELTGGEMGTKPPDQPRRYEPPQKR